MEESNTYKEMETDIKKLEENIAYCQQNCDQEAGMKNMDMARMYEKDVKDLTDILNCTNEGDFKLAWSVIDSVDTAVREEIPTRLYNFIAKKNGYV